MLLRLVVAASTFFKITQVRIILPLDITSPAYSIRSDVGGTAEVNVKSFVRDFTTKICGKILDEMLLRFPPESMIVLTGIDSLNPKSARFLEEKLLQSPTC
mgnify:CR=1 FL=1